MGFNTANSPWYSVCKSIVIFVTKCLIKLIICRIERFIIADPRLKSIAPFNHPILVKA